MKNRSDRELPRRTFLEAGTALGAALLGVACGADMAARPDAGGGGQGGAGGKAQGGGGGGGGIEPTPECLPSAANIEGPFYTPGAPDKDSLHEAGMPGTRLHVTGQVLGTDCKPLAGAELDVWQADDAGDYDHSGYTLRGKTAADASGRYAFETIIPGHYLNGASYRPAHIHVKASAPGFALLTTQLYFPDDPFNEADSFIKPELIMAVTDAPGGGKAAVFDFVLRPA